MIAEPTSAADHSARNIRSIPLDKIVANVDNPRQHFDSADLQELADSIRMFGLQQPIVVRPVESEIDPRFEIIMGERRCRASRMAGLTEIDAIVREDVDERSALELALIENLHRRDINAIEEAQGYRKLLSMGHTVTSIAQMLGRSQPAVSNALRILDLPEEVSAMVADGRLSRSHGIALCGCVNDGMAVGYAAMALDQGWPSKRLEQEIAEARRKHEERQQPALIDADPEPVRTPADQAREHTEQIAATSTPAPEAKTVAAPSPAPEPAPVSNPAPVAATPTVAAAPARPASSTPAATTTPEPAAIAQKPAVAPENPPAPPAAPEAVVPAPGSMVIALIPAEENDRLVQEGMTITAALATLWELRAQDGMLTPDARMALALLTNDYNEAHPGAEISAALRLEMILMARARLDGLLPALEDDIK